MHMVGNGITNHDDGAAEMNRMANPPLLLGAVLLRRRQLLQTVQNYKNDKLV